MHKTCHVQQAQALQKSQHNLLELLRVVSLEYAHNIHVLLHLIYALTLEKLALSLQQNFGEGTAA